MRIQLLSVLLAACGTTATLAPDGGSTPVDAAPGAPDAAPPAPDPDAGPAATTFRVWAPNATAVAVAGSFPRAGLEPLGEGVWSATLPVAAGASYHFELDTPDGP